MSFKDKPLKKINADIRVTIDVLHKDITNDFKQKRDDFLKEKEIKEYDFKSEVDYYLNTGEVLSEYYSKKEDNSVVKKEISVLDFMNRSKKIEPVPSSFAIPSKSPCVVKVNTSASKNSKYDLRNDSNAGASDFKYSGSNEGSLYESLSFKVWFLDTSYYPYVIAGLDAVNPESAITNHAVPDQKQITASPRVERTIWFEPVALVPHEVTVMFATNDDAGSVEA